MNATRYFEPNLPGILALPATGAAGIAPIEQARVPRRTATVQVLERRITLADVCDLIAAAGPLTSGDIAGGLGVAEDRAAAQVQSMVARGDLQEDEFGRYMLRGQCLRHAS
jgi:hypothetical protein